MEHNTTSFTDNILEEFGDLRSTKLPDLSNFCSESRKHLTLNDYQKFVIRYMEPRFNNKGLYVIHGLGSGKTWSSITISENYPEKHTVVILPAKLRDNFVRELKKHYPARYKNYDDILKKYTFISYNASNFYQQAIRAGGLKNETFDNKMVIIDEAHLFFANVISGGAVQQIKVYNMMEKAKNAKFLFLSGTPIVKDPYELVPAMNLLRGQMSVIPETASGGGEIEERTIYNRKGKEVILPEPRYIRNDSIYDYDEWNDIDLIRPMRYNAELAYGSEKVATGGGNRTQTHHHLFPDRRDLFYQYFIDAKKNHFINRSVFQDRITGLFSFYCGIIDKKRDVIPETLETQEVLCEMQGKQWKYYEIVRAEELDRERISKHKKEQFEQKRYKRPKRENIGGYKAKSRQYSLFTYPESIEKHIKQKLETNELERSEVSDYKFDMFSTSPALIKKVNKDLENYSIKYHILFKNILPFKTGIDFIYSFYKSTGVRIIELLLEERGYISINRLAEKYPEVENGQIMYDKYLKNNSKNDYKRIIVFDGDIDIRVRKIIYDLANLPENTDGKIVRIIIGTQVIAEGVSFKAIRRVSLMETNWSIAQAKQIIGRAVRLCSHNNLKHKERTVAIYQYICQIPKKARELKLSSVAEDGGLSSDEIINKSAKAREELSSQFLNAIKEVAVDCQILQVYNKYTDGIPVQCRVCENKNEQVFPHDIVKHLIDGTSCSAPIRLIPIKDEPGYFYDQEFAKYMRKGSKIVQVL
jgi:hypothetical protein